MQEFALIITAANVALIACSNVSAEEEAIDASDPTKIYSYAGGGLKYTDYTNNESMLEVRAMGNFGFGEKDTVMFELGYGSHDGDLVPGSNNDITNGRVRWFHLFEMNPDVLKGYRGWATQVDLQLAGSLKGTNGQNTLALGYMAAFGISEKWSFYLPLNVVNTWDKNFEKHNGVGIGAAPMFAYSPDNWWAGAFLQIWPNYTYFVSGNIKNEGAGNIDVTTGGSITPTMLWSLTLQKNVDIDLRSFRRGPSTGLTNDWNVFVNISSYF